MKRSLVQHLVCPLSKQPLDLEIVEADATGEIKTGRLTSAHGSAYEIRNWVPRFVDRDSYGDTFTRQRLYARKHFDKMRHDNARQSELFIASTGFSLSAVEGLTLDAGCGPGRFCRVVGESGGEVIGVDLSASTVELAFEFTGRHENVHIIQADLTNLPFRNDTFQRIFSIGVLDHTPDTGRSFKALVPYLRSGGEIAIWVYAPETRIAENRWRRLSTKLPLSVVYGWCLFDAALLAWLRELPGGGKFSALVPGPGVRDTTFWERVLGNFDSLTPHYAHSHAPDEVLEWFRTSGLVDVEARARRTSVRGRKPFAAPSTADLPQGAAAQPLA